MMFANHPPTNMWPKQFEQTRQQRKRYGLFGGVLSMTVSIQAPISFDLFRSLPLLHVVYLEFVRYGRTRRPTLDLTSQKMILKSRFKPHPRHKSANQTPFTF